MADETKPAPTVVETAATVVDAEVKVTQPVDETLPTAEETAPSVPLLHTYELKHGDVVGTVEACDEIAARAIFNDRRSKWPSPSQVKCKLIK